MKLGPQRIGAYTDGGFQIMLPQDGEVVEWDRSYYEIALEVSSAYFWVNERQNGSLNHNPIKMAIQMYQKSIPNTLSMQAKSSPKC